MPRDDPQAARAHAGSGAQRFVKVASPQIDAEEIDAVAAVLRSGQYVSGRRVADFERAFADYVGTTEAVAVNSGTAALHLSLAAADVGPGDEVIVPALTFFSTVSAVIHQGAVPVFADISPANFCLSPEDLRERLTPRTRAVIPVHYFGHAAEMEAISTVANGHGLTVIEDCAQSHGTTYKGQRTGALADFGAFSFFATKHMTTGEGGMITTDDTARAERMRSLRNHGLQGRDDHVELGYNYRMTEMAAAIGLVQLGRLDELNQRRVQVSEALFAELHDLEWLELPKVPPHVQHTYFWAHVRIDEDKLGLPTAELIARLRARGVETRNRYTAPLYRQPLFKLRLPRVLQLSAGAHLPDYGGLYLPNVEAIAGTVIGLPNRPDMTTDEIAWVSEVLHDIQRP